MPPAPAKRSGDAGEYDPTVARSSSFNFWQKNALKPVLAERHDDERPDGRSNIRLMSSIEQQVINLQDASVADAAAGLADRLERRQDIFSK